MSSKLKGIANFVQWMIKIISSPEHVVSYRVIWVKALFFSVVMKGAGRWLAARSSFQEDLIVGIQDKVLTLRVCWCNPSSKRSLGSTLSSSTLTQLSTVYPLRISWERSQQRLWGWGQADEPPAEDESDAPFLVRSHHLIWSRNAREDGMETLPAMQPLFDS